MPAPDSPCTRILHAVQEGRINSVELLPVVYNELRRLAASKLGREAPGQTLQATALVHEAWLRVGGKSEVLWDGRHHFYAAAAEAMRRILVDNARRKKAVRHGGAFHRTSLSYSRIEAQLPADEVLQVDEALGRLGAHDPRKAELVKLRYFVGLTLEEAAAVLGVSHPTAKRDWAYARAWLRREISRQ